jgi:hypothetical protein
MKETLALISELNALQEFLYRFSNITQDGKDIFDDQEIDGHSETGRGHWPKPQRKEIEEDKSLLKI